MITVSDEGRQAYPSDTSLPMISVVVPMRNEERHIAECLESLLRQDYPPARVEILVVDGMSEDRSREIVGDFVSRNTDIELLDNPRQIPPTAMNIGIQQAKGDMRVDDFEDGRFSEEVLWRLKGLGYIDWVDERER